MAEILLKQQLAAHGMTLAQVAEELHISAGSLSQMTRNNIRLSTLESIAKVIGIEPYELFITKEELEMERQRRFKQLTPHAEVFCPCCGRAICIQTME